MAAANMDVISLVQKSKKDVAALLSSLHTSEDENQWAELLNNIQTYTEETKWGALYVLKALILKTESVMAMKNLMLVFVGKMSKLISEHDVLKRESLSAQFLALLKDFWALFANQHYTLTKCVFGTYTAEIYEVLPSLASLYIDLFVASNSSNYKTEILSKRLHGWLNFELNERCLKTALLEVSNCTPRAASFLLRVLRKVLQPPLAKQSFMDYLLHFVALRRWSLVSPELDHLQQGNLNVKAPKNFVDWLWQKWVSAKEHLPQDKSLKGRRVSEFFCTLDSDAVEELIDVFSHCLLSMERQEVETEAPGDTEAAVRDLFMIDKTGSEQDRAALKKKRKLEETTEDSDLRNIAHSKVTGNGSASDSNDVVMSQAKINRSDMDRHGKNKVKKTKSLEIESVGFDKSSSLGFMLDRTATKIKGANKAFACSVDEGKEEGEETNFDENDNESIVDARLETEHSNEEVDDDEDDTGHEKSGVGEEGDVGSNDGCSNEEIDEDDDNVNDIGVSGGKSDSNDEDNSEAEENDTNDNSDGDDDESGEEDHKMETKTSSSSAVFPSCEKDPALSYFVSASPNKNSKVKKAEMKIIDGTEIQVIHTFDSKSDIPGHASSKKVSGSEASPSKQKSASSSDVASSGDDVSRKRKRKLSESKRGSAAKKIDSDVKTQDLRDLVDKSEDGESLRKSKRLRTESGSSSNGKMFQNDGPAEESLLISRATKASKTRIGFTDGDISNTGEHSQNRRRLRSDSESSKTMIAESSSDLSHNIRRVRKISESHVDHEEHQNFATTEQKHRNKDSKINSPKKQSDSGSGCEKTIVETEIETPKEAAKDIVSTEEHVGLVLSEIRKSLNDDLLQNEKSRTTRYTTRLRTVSESFDVQPEMKAKTTTKRRQTLTGIKAKAEPPLKVHELHGSTNLLKDWLRKPKPSTQGDVTAEEEKIKSEKAKGKSPNKFIQNVEESISDNEVNFNHKTSSKTYSGSSNRRARSPRRILIETKTPSGEKSPETPRSKSSEKVSPKSNTASRQSKGKDTPLRVDIQSKGNVAEDENTPKPVTDSARVSGDKASELIKTPQASSATEEKTGPSSRRRKYYLRGSSPVKSPTGEMNKSLTKKTSPISIPTPSSSSSPAAGAKKNSPSKSPAGRRKSLRSSSKQK